MPVSSQSQHAPHGDVPRMALHLVDIIGPGPDIRRYSSTMSARLRVPLRPVTRLTMMPASGESMVTEPLSWASMVQPSGMSTVKKLSAPRGEARTGAAPQRKQHSKIAQYFMLDRYLFL